MFSHDTYLRNLKILNKKSINKNPNIYSKLKDAHLYIYQRRLIDEFTNLLKNENDKQIFLDYLKYKRKILNIILARHKFSDTDSIFIQNCCEWIEELIKQLDVFQQDFLKKGKNTITLFQEQKKFINNIFIEYEEIENNTEICDEIFLKYFNKKFKIENNKFDVKESISYLKFLHFIDQIYSPFAFYILTNIFGCIYILQQIINPFQCDLKNEKVGNNTKLAKFIIKFSIFHKIYLYRNFIIDIENYKEKNFSYLNDMILFNDQNKKEYYMAVTLQIKEKMKFQHSILIFLCFVVNLKFTNKINGRL